MTIRVFIVDDHPVVRSGLRATLEPEPDIEVIGEAGTAERAIAEIPTAAPDVVLMDLRLGDGMSGAGATARLAESAPGVHVLILTTYDSDADILQGVEAGATGYLLKDTDPAELAAAVRTASRGETVLSPSVAGRLVSRVRSPGDTLTTRETQIMRLVAEGHTNQAIARQLFITEATVKSHLVQVFAKLSVDTRTAAVAEARRRGIVRLRSVASPRPPGGIAMKRLFIAAQVYMVLGLAGGLFYREFTHADDFTGDTQLSVVHTHLLTLGMLFFLLLVGLEKLFRLTASKVFGWFYWFYNVGLVWTVTFMVIHGIRTIDGKPDNAALDGISGLGHIIITVGIFMFFACLGRRLRDEGLFGHHPTKPERPAA